MHGPHDVHTYDSPDTSHHSDGRQSVRDFLVKQQSHRQSPLLLSPRAQSPIEEGRDDEAEEEK